MKVACLQFAPEVGTVQENIARADSILLEAQLPFDIDWLVLPELAFTGKQPIAHWAQCAVQIGRCWTMEDTDGRP